MIAAPKPKVARKIATIEALNVRFRNRWSGMIGSAARDSTKTKTPRKTTPADDRAPDRRVAPLGRLGQGQADQDRHQAEGQGDDAEVVDLDVAPAALDVRQQPGDHDQGDDPDRQVDEEDPVPAEVVGQEAAQARADEEGDAEDGPEQALVLAPLGRG